MINYPKESWVRHEETAELSKKIQQEFSLLPQTARLLVNRGLQNLESVSAFLNPQLSALINPNEMHGMRDAVERVYEAIQNQERILIHGDYDADGVTSTAVLFRFFRDIGITAEVIIPNRLEESHGINQSAIDKAIQEKISLVITCDCGVAAATEIAELKRNGIDTIVTDHHSVPPEGVPKDTPVLNPHQEQCSFPDKHMTGVGIAYYLVIGVRAKLREQGFFADGMQEPNLRTYLDLVAMGTIADVAPLIGQNRIFVKEGLRQFENSTKVGLRVLLNLCLPIDRAYSAKDIAFSVAPKINAAGRLGFAMDAFSLLVEEDQVRAAVLGRKVLNHDTRRREIEAGQLQEAVEEAGRFMLPKKPTALVLYKPHWHLGVVGIVAQRLVERYALPVVLLGKQGDRVRGSIRSVENIHVLEHLHASAEHLKNYGGHSRAAGVTLQEESVDNFREAFCESIAKGNHGETKSHIYVDDVIALEHINEQLINEFEQLKPFGVGNPEPVFQCEQIKPHNVQRVGSKKEHLRLALSSDNGTKIQAIAFRFAQYSQETTKKWDVLLTPEYNWWQGRKSIQARVHAISVATLS